VVPLNALDAIWTRVASVDKRQVILERGGHIITEDYDKDLAFAAIDQFLQAHATSIQRET
jgi:esterase/lipase